MVPGLATRGTVIVPKWVDSRDSILANQSVSGLVVNCISMSLGIGPDEVIFLLG